MESKTDSVSSKKTHRMPKPLLIILSVFLFLLIFFLLFSGTAFLWMMNNWSSLSLYELISQLKTLNGAAGETVVQFVFFVLVPSLLVTLLLVGAFICFHVWFKDARKRKRSTRLLLSLSLLSSFCFSIPVYVKTYRYLEIGDYLTNSRKPSDFIDMNYVSPHDVSMEFPEKKRNLILLTMESMETTYSDTSHGGFFEDDYLKGLSDLALENECFSDPTTINGATTLEYTNWTMAALFAYSTGLPFKTGLGQNNMDTQETFFPNVVSLGDILNLEGYNQTFLCGSDSSFAGRKLYYESHGNYQIHDYYTYWGQGYNKAENQWGFMDYHLFGFAKDEIREKAKEYDTSSKPFNYTILTVDTHFYVGDTSHPDGFVCQYCQDEYPLQYANVISCSSRQAADFVDWFFGKDGNTDISDNVRDNTTVVILGDHPTMSSSFCLEPDKKGYARKTYVNFINSAVSRTIKTKRTYSHFDIFPTILRSIGVTLSSPYLALGVDLYSDVETYLETYEKDYINIQLQGKSSVIESLLKVNPYEYNYLKRIGRLPTAELSYLENEDSFEFRLSNLNRHGLDEELDQLTLKIESGGKTLEYPFSSENTLTVLKDRLPSSKNDLVAKATIHGVTSENTYILDEVSVLKSK